MNRSKTEEAILFSVNDIPIVSAFGLYREEPENSLHTMLAPAARSGDSTTYDLMPGSVKYSRYFSSMAQERV